MRVLSINLGNFGSTGNIAAEIGKKTSDILDWETYYAFPESINSKPKNEKSILIRRKLGWYISEKFAYYASCNGMVGYLQTKWFLWKVNNLNPTIIHFHNLHNSYIHLPLLFAYVKKEKKHIVWTLHDCWAFTAQCPYFTMAKCDKWKTGCHHCPQYRSYPGTYVDRTKTMWKLKKKWFTGVEDLTIVTPSQWLADLVKESFLKDYPVKVIHNGIDLNIFKPMPSNFREKYGIPKDKKILLGVAFGWGVRKGLDVFVELGKRLDPEKYQIVLVGTDEKVDKQLPAGIISIHRTQNQQALAEIYSAADLFVNPTREENYPTVNMESIACGTPVLTFRTGGSPEILDENTGSVVECDDIDALEREIIRICDENPYSMEACLTRAKSFDMNERFEEYIRLYEKKDD